MPLLRLNEHYTSIQGEGPNTGALTQFIRFSGCNMRCPGWPCDTQHAIQPALFKDDPKLPADTLLGQIRAMRNSTGAAHLCITGGEPFMQDMAQLKEIVDSFRDGGEYTIDIFTNGSFLFPSWISLPYVTIVMDWKLPGSGEHNTKLEAREINASILRRKDAIKFVVKDLEDLQAALTVTQTQDLGAAVIWVGRVWDAEITNDDIIAFLAKFSLNWHVNVQMHKYLWPDIERGI